MLYLCVKAEEVKELVTQEVVEKCGKRMHNFEDIFYAETFLCILSKPE